MSRQNIDEANIFSSCVQLQPQGHAVSAGVSSYGTGSAACSAVTTEAAKAGVNQRYHFNLQNLLNRRSPSSCILNQFFGCNRFRFSIRRIRISVTESYSALPCHHPIDRPDSQGAVSHLNSSCCVKLRHWGSQTETAPVFSEPHYVIKGRCDFRFIPAGVLGRKSFMQSTGTSALFSRTRGGRPALELWVFKVKCPDPDFGVPGAEVNFQCEPAPSGWRCVTIIPVASVPFISDCPAVVKRRFNIHAVFKLVPVRRVKGWEQGS